MIRLWYSIQIDQITILSDFYERNYFLVEERNNPLRLTNKSWCHRSPPIRDEWQIFISDFHDLFQAEPGWYEGIVRGKRGLLPANHVIRTDEKQRQVRVVQNYRSQTDGELTLKVNDIVSLVDENPLESGWLKVKRRKTPRDNQFLWRFSVVFVFRGRTERSKRNFSRFVLTDKKQRQRFDWFSFLFVFLSERCVEKMVKKRFVFLLQRNNNGIRFSSFFSDWNWRK